jgi:MATE family multidrug resistance protein
MFNAIGNYVLGFGKLGFPHLGLGGIAGASALSQWAMVIVLILYIRQQPQLKTYQFFRSSLYFNPQILKELLWVGVPIALSFTLESGLFIITTYMMGALGTQVLAAHQIVFQTIVIIFMVPLGISFATTIRVGQWHGQKDLQGVKRAAYTSMGLGTGFMVIMAIVLLLFPYPIISLYLDIQNPENAPVIALVIPMFRIAALSQILDGLQATIAGALRGLQDTRMPVLLSLLSFWGVGLTSGYLLGFVFHLDGVGLWLGQLLGVAVAAGIFWGRFRYNIFVLK